MFLEGVLGKLSWCGLGENQCAKLNTHCSYKLIDGIEINCILTELVMSIQYASFNYIDLYRILFQYIYCLK